MNRHIIDFNQMKSLKIVCIQPYVIETNTLFLHVHTLTLPRTYIQRRKKKKNRIYSYIGE